jgi:hypothetical protein
VTPCSAVDVHRRFGGSTAYIVGICGMLSKQ